MRIERNKVSSNGVARVGATKRRRLARGSKSQSILSAIGKNPAIVKELLKSGSLKGQFGLSRIRLFVKSATGRRQSDPVKQMELSLEDLSELATKAGELAESRKEFRAELRAAIAEGDRLLKKAGC